MKRAAALTLTLAAIAAAVFFRFSRPALRPMHHDEANQAVKFGTLLERGEYAYDKNDHHGPVLYYLTLPAAKALGRVRFADIDEALLRAVPAVFGVALIFLLPLFGIGLQIEARIAAALLIAVSPAMTYFSRFYIQEMIFVFFVLGFLVSLWRYILRPDGGWYVLAGIFAGLMAATKETSVIIFAAAGLGLGAVVIREKFFIRKTNMPVRRRIFAIHIIVMATVAAAIAAMFFSSFGRHPEGIKDAVTALNVYVERGSFDPGFHAHPFFFYLGRLAVSIHGGLIWTELFVLLLGLAGMIFIFIPHRDDESLVNLDPLPVHRSLGLFLVVYTVAATLAYSLIPYKTPWNMLAFYLGWLILAGIGAISIFRRADTNLSRAVVLLVLAAGLAHLAWQSRQANFSYPADPRNPYVYAQTSPDFLKLVRRIEALGGVDPEERCLAIKVVAGPYEQWPLPWYLRKYANVGYWTRTEAAGSFGPTSLVIASAENAESIRQKLGERYIVENFGLRPEVLLTLFIPPDLWNEFMKSGGGKK
ncbi:MAG: flippase activity-associated protein Agl23 [Candidatus Aminicenantales bacterium]